jgi:hypothetical protein
MNSVGIGHKEMKGRGSQKLKTPHGTHNTETETEQKKKTHEMNPDRHPMAKNPGDTNKKMPRQRTDFPHFLSP